ncbi:hypothetical protein SARC_16985, partial [Sphaeroforma arctica JP610]
MHRRAYTARVTTLILTSGNRIDGTEAHLNIWYCIFVQNYSALPLDEALSGVKSGQPLPSGCSESPKV